MNKKLPLMMAACLLLASCSELPDIDIGNGHAIGGDWRTWRGYTSDYNLFDVDDVTFSRFTPTDEDPDSYGYAAYETEFGSRIGALIPPKDGTFRYENEADPALVNKDLDGDGIYEFGLCYNDGRVAWFGWDIDLYLEGDPFYSNPFVCIGIGDTEGIQTEGRYERGMIFSDTELTLTDSYTARAAMKNNRVTGSVTFLLFDTENNSQIGIMNVSEDAEISASDLTDENVPQLLCEDKDGDGCAEVGVPLKDGRIFWYRFDPDADTAIQPDGFGGRGDPMPAPPEKEVNRLSSTIEIRAEFGSSSDLLTIDIFDVVDGTCYGTLQINDPEITADDVVCTDGAVPEIVTRDLNEDGLYEVGIPLLSGVVQWYSLEDGEFLSQGPGTTEGLNPDVENELIGSMIEILGDRLEGKTIIRTGSVEVDGIPCEEYAVGTDHGDHFVTEVYYAMGADGTLYYYDAVSGGNYAVYQPD